MANNVILLGKTGTGKSTSIKGLDPKETVIINILGKKLPFKGSSGMYNKENKNTFQVEEYTQLINLLDNINKSAGHIKNIVVDDFAYIMRKEYFKRSKEQGYNKYTELATHTQQIINTCENMRDNINVFFIYHSEDVVSDGSIVEYKVATIGKLLDTQYNPLEVVPMVLFSSVSFNDEGKASYGFYTHRCVDNGITIPAKTPDGMFEDDFIPNDLGFVVKAMNEYYG